MMKAKQSPERWRHHVGKKVAKLELSLVSFTVVLLASFIELLMWNLIRTIMC